MQRFVLGLPFAGIVTAALFVLMYGLIMPGEIFIPGEIKERPYIPPPPKPFEPDPPSIERTIAPLPETPPLIRPDYTGPASSDPANGFVEPTLSVGEIDPSGGTASAVLLPLITMSPAYPANCLARGTSGHATVRYDVTLGGQVVNAVVTESSNRCFERAALDAIAAWRYQPAMTTEQGYIARGETKRFAFEVQ
ncbi:energy transducer TonB [Parvularcula dongshanensis]|uniref:Protein TonB n=1 Tax=Parvularcula dongshanensis TaxID=1173995 RepID=A0A840I1A0_9PROT|nr:TonB family protein [Parvularcula dongshanensis]MBB4658517.1 TonB family protein [Parvularcula dongshanensis]